MKDHPRILVAIAILAIGLSAAGARARDDDGHPPGTPPGGDLLPMARFYTGSLIKVGDFPGTLVCLRCDLKPAPGAMAQCEREGHRHALSMEMDAMIHPLLVGSAEVLKQINSGELHGKRVTVHGKYYSATGAILVDRISREE